MLRLSDEEETPRLARPLGQAEGLQKRALDAYLSLRRRRGGCLIICGYEGERESVHRRRSVASRRLRAGGAVAARRSAPGASWQKARFEGPYLRDELLGLGVFVETLETAHTWSRLDELYAAVGDALRGALGAASIVMCHVSHAYEDGASLYFTFLARARQGAEIEQWRRAKAAACEAIVATEGTITHHHAVGRDHAPYMAAEVGELGLDALRAVKERLDPAGIMNPGKLLPITASAPLASGAARASCPRARRPRTASRRRSAPCRPACVGISPRRTVSPVWRGRPWPSTACCRAACVSRVEASETSMQPNCGSSGMISVGIAAAPVRLPFSVDLVAREREGGAVGVVEPDDVDVVLRWSAPGR